MFVMQYEIHEENIRFVIDLAYRKGILIMWNCAPVRAFDTSYIPKINILVLNVVETGFLAEMNVENQSNGERFAGILIAKSVEKVIITLGSKGVFAVTIDKKVSVPPYKVDAVTTKQESKTFLRPVDFLVKLELENYFFGY